jgi:hypothetical protein
MATEFTMINSKSLNHSHRAKASSEAFLFPFNSEQSGKNYQILEKSCLHREQI